MRIRRVRPEECERVGGISVAANLQFLSPDDDYVTLLRDAARRDREAEVWVAVDEFDEPLGSVTICPPGSPWRELARDGEGEFRMLAVHPDAQGRGVGRLLVQHVLDTCRDRGDRAVVLSSLERMRAAHRVYERLGFVRRPDLDWDPIEGVHLIAYAADLTCG